jgi:hypothetical protein
MNTRTLQRNKWFSLIEEQEKSQLSIQAFCKEKGINYANLNYYRQQFKKQKLSSFNKLQQQIVPVQLKATAENNITPPNEIKLILQNGLQCIFPTSINLITISQLIKMLLSC